jgi:hypothetical protein
MRFLQVTLYRYDGEEWLNIISRDNQLAAMGWTKEETDYLLDMLEAYDLRFVVVADRYHVSNCRVSGTLAWVLRGVCVFRIWSQVGRNRVCCFLQTSTRLYNCSIGVYV